MTAIEMLREYSDRLCPFPNAVKIALFARCLRESIGPLAEMPLPILQDGRTVPMRDLKSILDWLSHLEGPTPPADKDKGKDLAAQLGDALANQLSRKRRADRSMVRSARLRGFFIKPSLAATRRV